MSNTRFVKAVFEDGTIAVRSSTSKTYTHAYSWKAINCEGCNHADQGFASSEDLARKGLASATAYFRVKPRGKYGRHMTDWKPGQVMSEMVAPAVEITAKEYRAILESRKGGEA
jgi:hypothetical protein